MSSRQVRTPAGSPLATPEATPGRRSSIRRRSAASQDDTLPEDEHTDVEVDSDIDSMIPNARTFVRAEAPRQLNGTSVRAKCRGVAAELSIRSHICCGGGVIKGTILLCFDNKAKKNKSTQVASIQVDCIGVESVKGHEPKLFFTVAQDILTSGIYLDDLKRTFLQEDHIRAGQCTVPFELQLPLDVGPGTFACKDAEIVYTLMSTIVLVNSKRFTGGRRMQISRKVRLYPCLDPQRALVPSTAPIETVEEGRIRFGGKDTLKVAARMYRPAWIAGQTTYVDVAITNDSTRNVFKIQLDLLRHVSFYKSAAASSAFQSVDQRVPDRVASRTVATNTLANNTEKSDNPEWNGVKAGARETTTCHLEVPTEELSVSAGRYFGTTYAVRVTVSTKGGSVELELPIVIVHINSLDVIPSLVKNVSRMIATYASPISRNNVQRSMSTSSHLDRVPSLGTSLDMTREDRHTQHVSSRLTRANSENTKEGLRRVKHNLVSRTDCTGSPTTDLASTKPGIQCDLRRALSLDYQARFSKLDISAEQASWTHGAPLAKRSPDRRKRDLNENLAHRLHRERTRNPSFYDIV